MLFRQLPAGFFQRVYFGELCPVQDFIHGRLCRPVSGQLRLMLGQVFFTVPGRLVAIEHRPGLGIVHRGLHKPGRFGEGGLRVPQLPGQLVKAIHRRLGAGLQRGIVGQFVLPQILERGGHLL